MQRRYQKWLGAKRAAMVVCAMTATIGFLEIVARYVTPKDSVFWDHPMMMPYSGGTFDPHVTYERLHESDDPRRPQRYVLDERRWYRLEPEPEIPPTGRLVLNLGDSSTWGWGLADRGLAYATALNQLLPEGVTSLNLGVPYYSSLEGLNYLRELIPKYGTRIIGVTLYFGNNDATENGQSDIVTLTRIGRKSERELWLARHSALYRLFRNAEAGLRSNRFNSIPRVSPDEYEANLRAIIDLCASYMVPVVIIEPPVPLSWQPAHITRSVSVREKMQNAWSAAELREADALYAMGAERIQRRSDSYRPILEQAIEHDWVIPRIKLAWRDRLRRFAKDPRVKMVTLPEPFIEAEYPWTFEDYCHPSERSHAEIASRVANALRIAR